MTTKKLGYTTGALASAWGTAFKRASAVVLLAGALGACSDWLTGGDVTRDPNNQTVARNSQFFVASQEKLWSYWGSDPARIAGIYTQQFHGLAN